MLPRKRGPHLKRRVGVDELTALRLLDDTSVTPRLYGQRIRADGTYNVWMEHTGRSLDTLPRSDYIHLRPWLAAWLPTALERLRHKGILHLDLQHGADRNITYHPEKGFRIVDFGKIEFDGEYSCTEEAENALAHLDRKLA